MTTPTVTPVETPTVTDVTMPTINATDTETTLTTGYTPTFSATTRTVLYVVCAILGGVGLVLTVVSLLVPSPTWLTATTAVMAYLPSYVANAFGVAYNPLKLAGK